MALSVDELLLVWRDAERVLNDLPASAPERPRILRQVARLRRYHARLTTETRAHELAPARRRPTTRSTETRRLLGDARESRRSAARTDVSARRGRTRPRPSSVRRLAARPAPPGPPARLPADDHDRRPDRRPPPRRLPRRGGLRVRLLRARRGDDGRPRRARRATTPVRAHHDPPRAGRGVHGRRLRPPHRPRRRRDGDARAGRDEPRHRRSPTPTSTGRRWSRSPARRAPTSSTRRPTRSSTSSGCSSRSRSGTPASSGSRRSPRSSARRSGVATLEKPGPTHIELPENLAAMAVDDDARAARRPARTYFPEPTDEAIAHAADLIADLAAAARPRRQRRPAAAAPRRSCGRSPAASTCRSRSRSWARARSTTARTCR